MSQKISMTRNRNKNTAGKEKADRTDKQKVSPAENEAAAHIIYLAGCVCNGLLPSAKRVSAMNLEELHDLSSSLSLNSLVYTALERTPGFELPDTPLMGEWKEERDREIYKSLMFDRAWEKLRAFMEENGIWHLLLKGLPMKEFYPEPGMRQMADVDVLFDTDFEEKIYDYFMEQGYESKSYQQGNADSYLKLPFYNFELHRELFTRQNGKDLCDYYKNVKDRLILNEGSTYEYHFTDEDFYIYCTVHTFKHFHTNGTSLRILLDCYVYLKVKKDDLDWDYIKNELTGLSLSDFEESCRILSGKLFSDPVNFSLADLTEKEQGFLDDFLMFGTYGTISNRVQNKLREIEPDEDTPSIKTKAKYLWGRIFPDMDTFKEYYPFFYKHKWLMPVGYVYRLIYKGITNREQMNAELHALRAEKVIKSSMMITGLDDNNSTDGEKSGDDTLMEIQD